MAARLIRLGIVDDHSVYRLGFTLTLEREGDLVVQWELGTLTDLHTMLETIPVDVVLMDLNLGFRPGRAGRDDRNQG